MGNYVAPTRADTFAYSLPQRYAPRSSGTTSEFVYVQERDENRIFTDAVDLRAYLLQFPEAPNDEASRLFVYYPNCRKDLKVALFDKQEFTRFAFTGFQNDARHRLLPGAPSCQCSACRSGGNCEHHALTWTSSFWYLDGTEIDVENRLEVKDSDDVVEIFASGTKTTFRYATWNLHYFRFPSRALDGPEFARDAVIFQSVPIRANVESVPLRYLVNVLREVMRQLDTLLGYGRQFLSNFSMQILSSRLESDRSIIRHLLEAAQFWKGVQTMIERLTSSLQNLPSDPSFSSWLEGAYDSESEIQHEAKEVLESLRRYADAINVDLVKETDFLIQRVTNLISIDESYRSRDVNASIRRLSWITFIFLPLVFAATVFGMNVDLLKNSTPWVNYIYFILPLSTVIAIVYLGFRYYASIWEYLKRRARSKQLDLGGGEAELEQLVIATDYMPLPTVGGIAAPKDVPLILACKTGSETAARQLLLSVSVGASTLNVTDKAGNTALHYAALHQMLEIVLLLLERGASADQQNKKQQTAFDIALEQGNDACVAAFLQNRLRWRTLGQREPDVSTDDGFLSSLHYAAILEDVQMYDRLIDAGYPREARDAAGRTPLFYVARTGKSSFVAHALERDINMHARDFRGWSVLHHAVEASQLAIVQLLLERGVPATEKTPHVSPAAGSPARHGGEPATAKAPHVSPAARSPEGYFRLPPVLCLAKADGPDAPAILELLAQHGADVASAHDGSQTGNNLAHLIASSARHDCAALLAPFVRRGGRLLARNVDGETPHHVAAAHGKAAVLRELARLEPRGLEAVDYKGQLPIQRAARSGHTALVFGLLKPLMMERAGAALAAGTGGLAESMREVEEDLVDRALDTDDAALMEQIIGYDGGVATSPSASAASAVAGASHGLVDELTQETGARSPRPPSHPPQRNGRPPTPPASFVTLFQRAVLANKVGVTKYLLGCGYDVQALASHTAAVSDTANAQPATGTDAGPSSAVAAASTRNGYFELSGRTLLQAAFEAGAGETARLLLEAGVPILGRDSSGWTCLHSAAYAGHVECTRLIIETCKAMETRVHQIGGVGGVGDSGQGVGGLLDAKDACGWTALDLAAFYKHDNVVELLKQATVGRQVADTTYVWQRSTAGSGGANAPQSSMAFNIRVQREWPAAGMRAELP